MIQIGRSFVRDARFVCIDHVIQGFLGSSFPRICGPSSLSIIHKFPIDFGGLTSNCIPIVAAHVIIHTMEVSHNGILEQMRQLCCISTWEIASSIQIDLEISRNVTGDHWQMVTHRLKHRNGQTLMGRGQHKGGHPSQNLVTPQSPPLPVSQAIGRTHPDGRNCRLSPIYNLYCR